MAQNFKETAHLKTDQEKYSEGWDRIFGKKKCEHKNTFKLEIPRPPFIEIRCQDCKEVINE